MKPMLKQWSVRSVFLMCLLAGLLPGLAVADADAGKVLFVSGDARITHANGVTIHARRGNAVEEGDVLQTAAASTMQVRLSDGTLLAVRPASRLILQKYHYSGKPAASDKSFFSLITGAFRSITGAIGKAHHDSYRVTTPNATIGIRGTDHETAYVPPGATYAKPGTYDKVNTGATVLKTAAGSVNIAPNQVGYVAGTGQTPQLLPAIPTFLQSVPAPTSQKTSPSSTHSATAQAGTQAATASQTETQATAASLASDDTRVLTTTTTTSVAATPDNLAQSVVLGTPLASGSAALVAGYGQAYTSNNQLADASNNGPFAGNILANNTTDFLGTNNDQQLIYIRTLIDHGTRVAQFNAAQGTLLESGSATTATGDTVYWGRWSGNNTVTINGASINPQGSFHTIYSSAAVTSLASLAGMTGTATYSLAGGTSPTDSAGHVGSVGFANMNVDFGAQQITSLQIGLTSVGGNNWNATLNNLSLSSYQQGGSHDFTSVSCTGTCTGTASGTVSGYFIGSNAGGSINSYALGTTGGSNAFGTVFLKK